MSNGGKGSGAEEVLAFILGLIGIGALVAILSGLANQPCPYCGQSIPKNSKTCPKCGAGLYW
ncbi:MAG TPA: zinc-ribbon domain-containing protein [Thermoplasmata archaeon]